MGDGAGRPLRVFLSHSSELRRFPTGGSFLAKVEDAVIAAGHVPVDMRHWSAEPHPAAQVCREAVEAADVYLGVLGFCYGSPTREHPETSYTELEFDTAQRAGKPLLVFLLDEDTEGPKGLLVDLEHGREQEAFRRRVSEAGIVRAKASTPDTLATLVERALSKLTAKHTTGTTEQAARVWRVPPRNQVFTGRTEVLEQLRITLAAADGGTCVVSALHGMGGFGKTALAIEYAHRNAGDYDLVWWVPSEDPTTIASSLAECARGLGLAAADDPVGTAVARLQGDLHTRARWLLVYDNAENPAALREHLPSGPGHVLITSRNPNWQGIATPVELDVLTDDDAIGLLQARAAQLTGEDAARIAETLDHLPLALTQAGAYLAQTKMAPQQYVELLEQRVAAMTDRGKVPDYPDSLAASWGLAFDKLDQDEPAALQLLTISAYLAPEPIPFSLFTGPTQTPLLPEPLATAAADPLGFTDLTSLLRTRALARVDTDTLQLHRLVQALLRDRHDHDRQAENGTAEDPK